MQSMNAFACHRRYHLSCFNGNAGVVESLRCGGRLLELLDMVFVYGNMIRCVASSIAGAVYGALYCVDYYTSGRL